MAALTIRLLGGMTLEHAGNVVELASPRSMALLAYLLLHRDGPHPRSRLAFLLWPDSDDAQARTNLRHMLYHLRRSIPESERFLALDRQRVRWRPDAPADLDVDRFEEALARAEQAEDVSAERACLEAAGRLYRGDLLPEMYEDWLGEARERLRDRRARALERLVTIAERQRDYGAALLHARQLVQHDPLAEGSYRRLMRLQARSGERAKAMHTYHSCVSMLQRELGVEPSPETRAAYVDIQRVFDAGAAPSAWCAADASAPATTRADGVPRLVGRQPELERLRGAWREAKAGRPKLVAVQNDSGIGKTRLVEEFARGLGRRGGTTVTTRCYAAEGALAFAPVSALLRSETIFPALAEIGPVWRREIGRVLPELADGPVGALAERWQRGRLFEALARAVLVSQPLLIVVDDLQWCDRDSLEWLHYLLRFDRRARVLVVTTVRTHDLAAHDLPAALLPALQRDDLMIEIELAPLGEAEAAALARSLCEHELPPERARAIVEESEGNPLFVVELVRASQLEDVGHVSRTTSGTAAALPPGIRAVIASRLQQISPQTIELMSMAAVIGREFDLELLVPMSRRSEDEVVGGLDELWQRRIVREVGAGSYDFSHDKLREVAYSELSLTRRALLHRHTAEALEGVGRAGVSGQIAHHFEHAGLPERAIPHHLRAAEAAAALYAHEDAVASFGRGLALLECLPPREGLTRWRRTIAAGLHEGLADVGGIQGRHAAAREHYERALEQVSATDRRERSRLWRKIGRTWVAEYRYDEALAALERSEAALGPEVGLGAEAWWHEWIETALSTCDLHYWRLDWRRIRRLLPGLESAVERHGTASQRAMFFIQRGGMAFARAGFVTSGGSLASARAVLAAAEEDGEPGAVATAHFELAFALLWFDDLAEAEEQFGAALALLARTGDVVTRVRCLTYLGFLHRKRGDVAATRAYARATLAAATDLMMPEYVGVAHGHLAWLAWRRGDLTTSVREGHAAVESWRTGQPFPIQWCAHLPLLATRLRQGRPREAIRCAAAMIAPQQQRLPAALRQALERAVDAGDDETAATMWLERAIVAAGEARML